MLFNKKIEPCCSYCVSGSRISEAEIMCLKKGIVPPSGQCWKFKYDPLKREPPLPAKLKTEELSAKDFSLE